MTDEGREISQAQAEQVAAYIAVLTGEMARLARSHKLSELAYLLDVARMEARQRSAGPIEGERSRIA